MFDGTDEGAVAARPAPPTTANKTDLSILGGVRRRASTKVPTRPSGGPAVFIPRDGHAAHAPRAADPVQHCHHQQHQERTLPGRSVAHGFGASGGALSKSSDEAPAALGLARRRLRTRRPSPWSLASRVLFVYEGARAAKFPAEGQTGARARETNRGEKTKISKQNTLPSCLACISVLAIWLGLRLPSRCNGVA